MKNISIITFINIIFAIAFIFVILSFKFFIDADKTRFAEETNQRYHLIAGAFLSGLEFLPTDSELKEIIDKLQVRKIKDEKKKLYILRKYKEFLIIESNAGRVRIFNVDKKFYIYIQKFGYNLFLKDINPKKYSFTRYIFILLFIISIIIFIYYMLIQKLKPLKRLHKNVDRFAKGDLSVQIKESGNDEIGKISKSFDSAVRHINLLIESKNLFLRNMMHELKTPVTKGVIVTEMLEDDENKKILQRVFERINEIISELTKIERLNTNLLQVNIQKCSLLEMINSSINLLIMDNNKCQIDVDNAEIEVDRELFIIVLKNLIHNAIKFSKDNKASIVFENNQIDIISNSPALKQPLSFYLEPFYQEEKRDQGLGIGLYVVNSILKAHKMRLEYEFKDNRVHFIIRLYSLS